MPDKPEASNDPKDFPIFSCIDKNQFDKMAAKMAKLMKNLPSVLKIDAREITGSESVLIEIFERVEKERIYFRVFCDGFNMTELNEGVLLCFWITKQQPFYHPKIDTAKLNAKIAVCVFINAIYFYSDIIKREQKMPDHFVNDLYYDLLYKDINKESLMLLAESFADKTAR